MTNNQLTAEELQERRKPLQDKDLQGVLDALEHPAGINAAGKQVVRLALLELQERRKADSEPVATLDVQSGRPDGNRFALVFSSAAHKLPDDVYFLYRHAQPAPVVDADDNFYSWFGREWHENYQHNQYTTAAKQMLGVMAESAWKAGHRAAMLQAEPVMTANKLPPNSFTDDELEGMAHGDNPRSNAYRELLAYRRNSPVIPDTWIPVSERMPEDEQEVITINKMGHRFVSFFDKHSGLFFDRLDAPAACCIEHVLVTHWMQLPAAPQEVK